MSERRSTGIPLVRVGVRAAACAVWTAGLALTATPASAAGGGLELVPHVPTLVFLIALFVVLILPLDRLLFQPLFRVLEQREEKIDGAKRRADRLARDADEVLARYQAQIREAREDAERERKAEVAGALGEQAATTASAREQAEAEVERARREVGEALESARSGLRQGIDQLARDAAERILGRALS